MVRTYRQSWSSVLAIDSINASHSSKATFPEIDTERHFDYEDEATMVV
jgi:hypothetical protein